MSDQKTDEQRQIEAQAMQRLQLERLRDEFAMAALSGCLSGALACGRSLAPNEQITFAKTAYIFADAMLAARTKEAK